AQSTPQEKCKPDQERSGAQVEIKATSWFGFIFGPWGVRDRLSTLFDLAGVADAGSCGLARAAITAGCVVPGQCDQSERSRVRQLVMLRSRKGHRHRQ